GAQLQLRSAAHGRIISDNNGHLIESVRRMDMVRLTLALALVVIGSSSAFAQAVTGTLVGTITDSESLPVPGVTITITEVNRNIRSQSVTNADGNYVFA